MWSVETERNLKGGARLHLRTTSFTLVIFNIIDLIFINGFFSLFHRLSNSYDSILLYIILSCFPILLPSVAKLVKGLEINFWKNPVNFPFWKICCTIFGTTLRAEVQAVGGTAHLASLWATRFYYVTKIFAI